MVFDVSNYQNNIDINRIYNTLHCYAHYLTLKYITKKFLNGQISHFAVEYTGDKHISCETVTVYHCYELAHVVPHLPL